MNLLYNNCLNNCSRTDLL